MCIGVCAQVIGILQTMPQNSYTVGRMEHREDTTTPPEIPFLTQDEVRRLFAVIPGKRDRALFQLAYHHGVRVSEVSGASRTVFGYCGVPYCQGNLEPCSRSASAALPQGLRPSQSEKMVLHLREPSLWLMPGGGLLAGPAPCPAPSRAAPLVGPLKNEEGAAGHV